MGREAVVVEANFTDGGFVISFSDGRIDYLHYDYLELRCTIAGEGGPPFCMGDIDRSGDTNFDDLLFVLRDWGACEN